MPVETPFFYANGVELGASPYDMNLRFIRNGFENPGGVPASYAPTEVKPTVQGAVSVTMSPSHLKAMIPALFFAIANYEKSFGEISLPPDARERWKQMFPTSDVRK